MFKIILILFFLTTIFGCEAEKLLPEPVDHPQHHSVGADEPPQTKEYYTCSMHPHIREPNPGRCPICQMNLTKVVIEQGDPKQTADTNKAVAELYHCKDFPNITSKTPGPCPKDDTAMVKREGLPTPSERMAQVKLRKAQLDHFHPELFVATTMKMSKKLRVLGQVKSAEERASNIAARFPARVEKVFVQSVGSQIKKGDPVVQVYSPELLTTGEELILSAKQAKTKAGEFVQFYAKAREKLLLWGIRPSQIDRWVKTGRVPKNVTLYAKASGVVRKRHAVPGRYFKEGQNYFELSDLSQVWVEMDVYEHDSNLIEPGQPVSLSFVAIPGKTKAGEIDFISPTINEKTRTLKVRTTIANDDGSLKPGMVAQGTITVSLDGNPIVVPISAVIDTGIRKIVWVQDQQRKYNAKLVDTGFLSDGYFEVTRGLSEGEKVVIEGNFMLDAQAQFFGGYEDFSPAQAPKHDH